MTRIVLVRHGQTEWNRVERFRGRADLPLNEVGLAQAEAAARRIAATWPASAVYSSPLKRAMETAKIIAEALDLAVQPLAGLMDIDYGEWQGLSPDEVAERYGDLYTRWLEEPHLVHIPGGESLGEVRERAMAALEEVIARHGGQTVVLVSHQVVNKVLLCAVLGLDNSHFWHIGQENGAINVFEYGDKGFMISLLNDTCHLMEG